MAVKTERERENCWDAGMGLQQTGIQENSFASITVGAASR